METGLHASSILKLVGAVGLTAAQGALHVCEIICLSIHRSLERNLQMCGW